MQKRKNINNKKRQVHIHKSDSIKADLLSTALQNVHMCHERGITVCGDRGEN